MDGAGRVLEVPPSEDAVEGTSKQRALARKKSKKFEALVQEVVDVDPSYRWARWTNFNQVGWYDEYLDIWLNISSLLPIPIIRGVDWDFA